MRGVATLLLLMLLAGPAPGQGRPRPRARELGGSCMIVVATDAPLDAQALGRVARRAALALGRTGSVLAHGSGDYVIAFSTGPPAPQLRDDALNPVFQATVEATEEAIYNSLFRATTVKGLRGRVAEAIPIDRVRDLLRKHGRVR